MNQEVPLEISDEELDEAAEVMQELASILEEMGVSDMSGHMVRSLRVLSALTDPDDIVYWMASSTVGRPDGSPDVDLLKAGIEWVKLLDAEVTAAEQSINKYKLNPDYKQWVQDLVVAKAASNIDLASRIIPSN